VLSGAVCLLASAVAVSLFDRAPASQRPARAVLFGAFALPVASGRDGFGRSVGATGLLTLAIVPHHFTAGAVTLMPDPTLVFAGLDISPTMLSFLLAGCAFVILGISLSAAAMDRRAKGALGRQKILLDTALHNMSQGLCILPLGGTVRGTAG